jgi:hypothetical protein
MPALPQDGVPPPLLEVKHSGTSKLESHGKRKEQVASGSTGLGKASSLRHPP